MPDTGAPWNIPYVENADLVSDWPADSLLVANAVAAGLSAAGGLVAVKHVLKTDTFSASLAAGAITAVTDLSITHSLADASNKLIISVHFGWVRGSSRGAGNFRIMAGASPILVGDAAGSRSPRTAAAHVDGSQQNFIAGPMSMTAVYAPGTTASTTYTVEAGHSDAGTFTVYVNRGEADTDAAATPRTASSFIIQEIKV